MKHNHKNRLLILQAWPMNPRKKNKKKAGDIFEEQSFDQSALKKLTEELSRTKKVIRRKKVLAGKERASIRA